MQISKNLKLHKACSNDDRRPALTGVYYDGKHLVACDGHVLVEIKIPKEEQKNLKEPKIIPKKVFQEITKGKRAEIGEFEVNGNKVKIGSNGSTQTFDIIEEPYPDYERVIPEDKKPVLKVNLDANLLKNLADALGSVDGIVSLTFTNDNLNEYDGYLTCEAAIPVEAVHDESGFEKRAIIMPCRG